MYNYKYPRAALTVDAIVFVKSDIEILVLLIERGREPYKNKWALPGGFIEMDETLEQACIRELEEETGLMVKKMHQFRAYDAINRDPRHRTISVVYTTELDKQKPVKGSDDATHAKWFALNELPELAFDHGEILADFFNINSGKDQ
ncbi:NUDIX domain-containing protein [Draconibacterium halophilum]|uniref:NUDIX hydrolase n=1 Tax=Draconibacterium halophilum TaxID=2706887 RepID=A0A6C0RCM9_9BACT|nr:NUDIX hydrolase [Draconibacterium halophilum]QIA07817.1 NUDIX hydrolase [Draconibacterium halophilum]